jgi:hypothetical protein
MPGDAKAEHKQINVNEVMQQAEHTIEIMYVKEE